MDALLASGSTVNAVIQMTLTYTRLLLVVLVSSDSNDSPSYQALLHVSACSSSRKLYVKLEYGPMSNVMVALPNMFNAAKFG